jgi:hypothetical protein
MPKAWHVHRHTHLQVSQLQVNLRHKSAYGQTQSHFYMHTHLQGSSTGRYWAVCKVPFLHQRCRSN